MYVVKLADIKLAKPAPRTLAKAEEILRGPLCAKAREVDNISSWVCVGYRDTDVEMNKACHANMPYSATIATNKGRPKFRYLVNYTCHACKPEYWGKMPECHVPFEGKRLRAVMAWYEFLAVRSHWARFFVGPKDMDTFLNHGHILDLSAPSFVVHFMCVAWRMPGEYIEQVDNWFELVERGIDPHLALGATMKLGDWNITIGSVGSRGHHLMVECTVATIAHFVAGVATVEKLALQSSNKYYNTGCNAAYGSQYVYGVDRTTWTQQAVKDMPALGKMELIPSLWGDPREVVTLDVEKFRTVWDEGWQWLMKQVIEHRQEAGF